MRFCWVLNLVLLFASCGDKKVYDVYLIDNKSNDTICVTYDAKENHEQSFENFITIVIFPHSEKEFYVGGSSTISPINENDDYLQSFDSLQIKPKNGSLKLDFYNSKNWNYQKDWRFLGKYKTFFKLKIRKKDIVLIKNKSSFIAVGTSHLGGEKGLVNQPRKLGYVLENISRIEK